MRKIQSPCFYPAAVKALTPIFNKKAMRLANIVDRMADDGQPFDFKKLSYAASADVVTGTLIDVIF